MVVSAFDVSAFIGCHNGRRVYSNAVAATILRRRYPLELRRGMQRRGGVVDTYQLPISPHHLRESAVCFLFSLRLCVRFFLSLVSTFRGTLFRVLGVWRRSLVSLGQKETGWA